MKQKRKKDWPEIVFSSQKSSVSQAIRRGIEKGELYKLSPKIYTSNFSDSPSQIIKRHRYQILSKLFPNAVISHRSALEGGISSEGVIVLTYKYTKNLSLPGLEIYLVKGPLGDKEDTPFLENLFISSRGRALLENIRSSRATRKTVSRKEIEERLERMIRIYGKEELLKLRQQAHDVAKRLGMKKELKELNQIIGALLGTRTEKVLKTEIGKSRAKGEPFDPFRIELFATLTAYLQQQDFPIYPRKILTEKSRINEAFFESYFSNYIEGTEFEIEEAEKIIFENKIFPNRPKDSHDILSTYQIITERGSNLETPQSETHFISLLLKRHAQLMESRKEKLPGKFKDIANRAGNTVFVKPEEVKGTLAKGYSLYHQLKPGISRAIYMMFLVAEVHPFIDGNGRIARIMMNAELDNAQESRIIIPTVYREDYLLALRKFSRQGDPKPYTHMLIRAQQFTAAIPFEDYNQALTWLKRSNAFLEPTEGKLRY